MGGLLFNPFTNRSTIRDENAFIGREQGITNILSRIRNGDSVSVVGPRRIGKSSLLYHLFLTGNRRLDDIRKTRFRFIYLDLQEPHYATQARFCKTLLQELNIEQSEVDQNADDLDLLDMLSRALDQLRSQDLLPVLLMDEFERLVAKPSHFTDDCFNGIRAFACAHKLCMVTSSQHTLKELTEKKGLTSPLWNIFMIQPLGEFIVSNVVDEVTLFLMHYWSGELKPSPEEQSLLISYCSTHPLIMQVASYWILRNRELGFDEIALKEEMRTELSAYFRGKSESFTCWLKKKGPAAFKKIIWTAEQISKLTKLSLSISIDKDK